MKVCLFSLHLAFKRPRSENKRTRPQGTSGKLQQSHLINVIYLSPAASDAAVIISIRKPLRNEGMISVLPKSEELAREAVEQCHQDIHLPSIMGGSVLFVETIRDHDGLVRCIPIICRVSQKLGHHLKLKYLEK